MKYLFLLLLSANTFAANSALNFTNLGVGGGGSLRIFNVAFSGGTEGTGCSSSPCTLNRQYDSSGNSDTVASITRTGTGDYTMNITSGRCSQAPVCSIVEYINLSSPTGLNGNPTSTSFRFYTDAGATDNGAAQLNCTCVP